MSKKQKSIWKKHPELEEELLRIVRSTEESIESISQLLGHMSGWAQSQGLPVVMTEASVMAKLYHEARFDDGIQDFLDAMKGAEVEASSSKATETIFDKLPKLRERLSELVRSGVLVEKTIRDGVDTISATLREEFGSVIDESDHGFSKRLIKKELESVIWTDEVEDVIKVVVYNHRGVEDFLEHCSWIPASWAEGKYVELSGTSGRHEQADFRSGYGRIAIDLEDIDVDKFELPGAPEDLRDLGEGDSVAVLNGVNLGIPYGGLIEDNPGRMAFEDAEVRGDSAMVLVNFLDIDTTRAHGATTVLRKLFSGQNINTKSLAGAYAQKADAILDQRPVGGIVYETTEELFEDLLSGWRKITVTPHDDGPEFSGPVYVVWGYKEEVFLAAATYHEVRYWTIIRQNELDVDISIKKKAVAAAMANDESQRVTTLKEELQALEDERSRTIISNVAAQEWQYYHKQTKAFFARKIEETIPNSTVVSVGSTLFPFGDKSMEIYIPGHARQDRGLLLSRYCKTYGPKVLRGDMADLVVICHPYALGYRTTAREVDSKGSRGSSEVVVAPITVDEGFLRETADDQVRDLHSVARAVNDERFESGMLRVEYVNGTLQPVRVPVSALGKRRVSNSAGSNNGKYDGDYIWMAVFTDPHFGSPTREQIEVGNLRFRGVTEAVIEMLRREGQLEGGKIPIHMLTVNDDGVQAHNFATEKQPHPKKAPFTEIEKFARCKVREIRDAETAEERDALIDDFRRAMMMQLRRRGEIWTVDQILQLMEEFIEENVDFFSSQLQRAVNADLEIRGVSAFDPDPGGLVYDSRDPGARNWGTGNHIKKSTDGEMVEGVLYRNVDQSLLRTLPEWRGKKELIRKLVRAPMYGNIFVAYGTVSVPGGYTWTLDLRSAPPKMKGWEDPLRGWVDIDLRRGNYSKIADIGKTLKVCGDKHFFASVSTPYAQYVMSAPDTPTDVFAEWAGGFPPNNTGVSFVGLPVDGPESGPVIVRTLRFDRIKEYFENDENFDWDTFLPNPA